MYFAFANSAGISGLAHNLFATSAPVAVVKIVKTSAGYALALNANVAGARAETVIVPLNPFGQLAGPAHKFEGSNHTYGIAAQGDGIGIVAQKTNGSTAFRALDAMGAPVGPWVCLDTPTPNRDHSASIAPDGAGYAALYLAPDGATYLRRFDRTGTGGL